MELHFGQVLREWRGRRRLSQFDLGLKANVSARHVAFLETGRSRPSREMVIQLAEALEVPRPARNTLLTAAGYAAAYRSRALAAPEMDIVREAIDWTMLRHDPYPAMAIDRHWVMAAANQAATALLGALGVGIGDSLLDVMCAPGRGAALLDNWGEAGHHLMVRLRTESAHYGGDPVLEAAATRLAEDPDIRRYVPSAPLAPVIPIRYRAGPAVLSFITTIAQFGTAEDMALADLRIELLFPADAATRSALHAASTSGHG